MVVLFLVLQNFYVFVAVDMQSALECVCVRCGGVRGKVAVLIVG